MRCPYCGSLNNDQASLCVHCGKDIDGSLPSTQLTQRPQPPSHPAQRPSYQPPQRPPFQPPQRPGFSPPRPTTPITPVQAPPYRQPAPPPGVPSTVPPTTPKYPDVQSRRQRTAPAAPPFVAPPVPTAPEAPAPFPPRSLEQLNALKEGALDYTVLDETVSYGRRKVVKISFQRCVTWQQVATLLKALRAHQSSQFECITIMGVDENGSSIYEFTKGKIQFDQNVRLGSQIIKRYQIETDNGLASDSLRVVLTE